MVSKRAVLRPRRAGDAEHDGVPGVGGVLGLDLVAAAGEHRRDATQVAWPRRDGGSPSAPGLVPHAGAVQRVAHVGDVEMDVDLAGRGRRLMREQPGHDLDRHAATGSARWRGCGAACGAVNSIPVRARIRPISWCTVA